MCGVEINNWPSNFEHCGSDTIAHADETHSYVWTTVDMKRSSVPLT